MNFEALLDGDGLSPIGARLGMYLIFSTVALSVVAWIAQSMLTPSFRRMCRYFRHRQRRSGSRPIA